MENRKPIRTYHGPCLMRALPNGGAFRADLDLSAYPDAQPAGYQTTGTALAPAGGLPRDGGEVLIQIADVAVVARALPTVKGVPTELVDFDIAIIPTTQSPVN